jgi:hypothetical protein
MANFLPPATASTLYQAIHAIALDFINAQTLNDELPSRMDFEKLRTYCSPSFQHSWGHNYAVSVSPPLQGRHDFDGFVAHLQSMLPKLASWKAHVTDIVVDEVGMKAVLRISFWMVPKGKEEKDGVENDLLWILEMERGGDEEEVKIKGSTEFMDGLAAGRLRDVMMGKA